MLEGGQRVRRRGRPARRPRRHLAGRSRRDAGASAWGVVGPLDVPPTTGPPDFDIDFGKPGRSRPVPFSPNSPTRRALYLRGAGGRVRRPGPPRVPVRDERQEANPAVEADDRRLRKALYLPAVTVTRFDPRGGVLRLACRGGQAEGGAVGAFRGRGRPAAGCPRGPTPRVNEGRPRQGASAVPGSGHQTSQRGTPTPPGGRQAAREGTRRSGRSDGVPVNRSLRFRRRGYCRSEPPPPSRLHRSWGGQWWRVRPGSWLKPRTSAEASASAGGSTSHCGG